jgi:hypothetical protein
MSGLDRPLFGLLEQLTSTDLNNVPGLGARTVLDAMRYSLNRDLSGTGAEALRDVVIGGLTMARTAAGVDVQPGALLQAPSTGSSGTPPRARSTCRS